MRFLASMLTGNLAKLINPRECLLGEDLLPGKLSCCLREHAFAMFDALVPIGPGPCLPSFTVRGANNPPEDFLYKNHWFVFIFFWRGVIQAGGVSMMRVCNTLVPIIRVSKRLQYLVSSVRQSHQSEFLASVQRQCVLGQTSSIEMPTLNSFCWILKDLQVPVRH